METKNIYFKSDFTVILASEAQWGGCPFRLSFYTASPSRPFVACFDGENYHNCQLLPDGRLEIGINQKDGNVQTLMGIGKLMLAIEFYLDNDAFRDHICNEFIKPFSPVFVDTDGTEYQVMLDMQGSSTLTTIGTLPAFYQKGLTQEEHDALIAATQDARSAAEEAGNVTQQVTAYFELIQRRFDESQTERTNTFNASERARTATFNEKEAQRDAAVAEAVRKANEACETLTNTFNTITSSLSADYASTKSQLAQDYAQTVAAFNQRMTAIEQQFAGDREAWAKNVSDFIATCQATFDVKIAQWQTLTQEAANNANEKATEAANVNAVLNGDNLTVTDRQGNSVTRNVRGPKGDSITMFPNVTIFGQPTIQESQISNFSADNYLQFPFVVDFAGRPWQIDCAITTGSNVSQQHNVLDSAFGLAFAFSGGKFVLALSSDGTSWNLGATSGTHTILANTTYYIRISWDGSVYKLAYSTDKETWVDDITVTSSASLASKQIIIGKSLDNRYIFNGSINMSEAHLTISGKIVWEGMDDAGLATRMAIDMSNIDDEGKQRLNDIAMQGAVGDAIKELQSLFGNGVEGYVRVSGVSDPAFNYRSYKHEVGAESVFDCLKPCLVGNNFTGRVGEILHVLNPLNWYETEDGRTVKLDATEGEVMICPTKTMYGISGHVTFGTVTYDVFLRSFVPFEWHGHPAEKIAPVGWSPSYTVAHKDDDNVTRMHSCYNPAFEGSYAAQQGIVGAFIQTQNEDGTISEQYDGTAALFGGAGGLHTTNLALYTGEQYAMNLNDDTTKTYPFMNRTAQCEELMFGNMLAEGGTFDAHNLRLMGSGFCSNDSATSAAHWEESNADARNGFRYVKQDGTWGYYSIGSNANFGYGATGDNLYKACMLNSWRSPWKCMEQQRVMIYAISNNIPELTWFAFEGNKYKWRHVDGFEGPSNGAMTCVVWKHFSSKLVQGCVEPGTTKDVSGNRCEFLICSALYRGVITDVSPSWWTSGLLFTQDADGTMFAYVQRDQKLLLKTPSTTSRATDAEPWPFENSYVAAGDFANSNAYCKDYNDATLFLPKNRATQTGAALHTYVGAYKYFGATKPSSGFSLRGFRRGSYANASNLSPLYVGGNVSPSGATAYLAFGICCEIESRGL